MRANTRITSLTRNGIVAALALLFVAEFGAEANAQRYQQRGRYQQNDQYENQQGMTEKRTVNVALTGRQEFYPPCTGGDREFGGNGPVMNFRTRVYCDDGRRVYRKIYVSAYENAITGGILSAPSSARGWSPPQLVYTAPAGWTIKKFRRTDDRFPEHFDRSHSTYTDATASGNLTWYGDTKGNDIGCYTRCILAWRSSVAVEISRPGNIIR